mmetsp:Transcript_37557/g.92328  ORF Transcript_37557/g.92328 Transcript_37557/m.92328 type:complete len:224 (+) Transcript_37557:325-996(+)
MRTMKTAKESVNLLSPRMVGKRSPETAFPKSTVKQATREPIRHVRKPMNLLAFSTSTVLRALARRMRAMRSMKIVTPHAIMTAARIQFMITTRTCWYCTMSLGRSHSSLSWLLLSTVSTIPPMIKAMLRRSRKMTSSPAMHLAVIVLTTSAQDPTSVTTDCLVSPSDTKSPTFPTAKTMNPASQIRKADLFFCSRTRRSSSCLAASSGSRSSRSAAELLTNQR